MVWRYGGKAVTLQGARGKKAAPPAPPQKGRGEETPHPKNKPLTRKVKPVLRQGNLSPAPSQRGMGEILRGELYTLFNY